MNMHEPTQFDTTASLARGALLVDLTFCQWTGRKKNKDVSDEVVASKGARAKNAASVYNALLGDCPELSAISKHVSLVRARHLQLTLPWSDFGTRLLPTPMLQKYQEFIVEARDQFDALVTVFLNRYDILVNKAAFELGTMFDRENYPTREHIQHKFSMSCDFSPVPLAGDFRVDLDSEIKNDMVEQYTKSMNRRLEQAQQDMWTRLHETLTHMVDRLAVGADGKPNTFRDTLVSNALEMVDLLKGLNPTNDPELEDARIRLAEALKGKDPEVLRKSVETREGTRKKVQDILDSFDFGI